MFFNLQLSHLQEENDSLVGKHSKHSQQLQEESINLPNNLEVWIMRSQAKNTFCIMVYFNVLIFRK